MPRLIALLILQLCCSTIAHSQKPITGEEVVFAERHGLVAVEAEHFFKQEQTDKRAFYLTHRSRDSGIQPDGDPAHVEGASGGAYLEILPDTRRTHADKLIQGTNFSPKPGKMAVLSYNVHITHPGKYYVWVRAFSTGSEDNGLHVGIDGTWPPSGQRLQWCDGKNQWRWESKQRTNAQHCGEPHKIFLQIDQPGKHIIHFSMREDGFEFDKWLMTTERNFKRPEDEGPVSSIDAGTPPAAFPVDAAIAGNKAKGLAKTKQLQLNLPANSYELDGTGYYLDQGKWAAINPDQRKTAVAGKTFAFPTGKYHVTLQAVGENDGQSSYVVMADDALIGRFTAPMSDKMFEEDAKFHQTWKDVTLTEGTVMKVQSTIGSADGKEFSRARWRRLTFEPADEPTRAAVAPMMAQRIASSNVKTIATSPSKAVSDQPLIEPRQPHGDGTVTVSGEMKQWHKITVDLDGPYAHEQDNQPNPFTDLRMTVRFQHDDGTTYQIPGYFAADGDAANSSAESGTHWRAHFAPDRPGRWSYTIRFETGDLIALNPQSTGEQLPRYSGITGQLDVDATDKSGRDFRAHGRLQYVGQRYLQHAGSKQYFVKAGADAPETLLAYADFDNTIGGKPKRSPIKTWAPHVKDWRPGDPTWKNGKGKGLIGAVNYLSSKGCNAFSFLTYNAGGDGDNVWPFIHRDDKLHYDCSKLDQWGIVFDHGTALGMYLHFKMQETENDDHRQGKGVSFVPECLDGGNLGVQRKLYCRELIARFGHHLALNWNLGEENTQTHSQQTAMIDYIAEVDAYDHPIVLHTYPNEQKKHYRPLLGAASQLTGLSLQNSHIKDTHAQTVRWVKESIQAGKPWVVAFDESGSAAHGQCPDLGYRGFDGHDQAGKMAYTEHEVRRQTLWGNLMGGGAGVEYYFGYQFAENDLVCQDWRSRDRSWDYCRVAIDFFRDHDIPIQFTVPSDELIGSSGDENDRYCLAVPGELYLIYLAKGGQTTLDLTDVKGEFTWSRLNPRTGDFITPGDRPMISGGEKVTVTCDDQSGEDWLIVLRKR